MNTIILNKRTMSPSNILNHVVEGDTNLLKKASEYFTQACRSTVGYKQIADYLKVTVVVITSSPSVIIEEKKVEECSSNIQHSINVLHHELARTNTLALHNLDRIIKNVWKAEKDILSITDKNAFRSLCIELREQVKDSIMSLPNGWYFTATSNLMPIIDSVLFPQLVQVNHNIEEVTPTLQLTEFDEEEEYQQELLHTPCYG